MLGQILDHYQTRRLNPVGDPKREEETDFFKGEAADIEMHHEAISIDA